MEQPKFWVDTIRHDVCKAASCSQRQQATRRSEAARQAVMRRQFGPGPAGVTCKTCAHLIRVPGGRHVYLKCARYRISASEATDWRAKWPACGAFEQAAS